MINVVLVGCLGRMGGTINSYVKGIDDCSIVAGVDKKYESNTLPTNYPIYNNICDISKGNIFPDVIIDFSHPSCLEDILLYGVSHCIPLVIATTGMSEDDISKINTAAKSIPIFFAPNMSLGINMLIEMCKYVIRSTGNIFDIEVIEKHHSKKIDAPSGTANLIVKAMEDQIHEISGSNINLVYDRHTSVTPRKKSDIGIHTVRGGDIIGEHEVIFAGYGELLQISHTATSKEIFAQGAISAARFIIKQKPGIYDVHNLITYSQ